MIDIFSSLSKLFRYRKIHIDGNVFRLHCTLTVIILMAFLIVISTKSIVGDAIECDQNEAMSRSMLNTYCFINSLYSMKSEMDKKIGDLGVVYPGIGNSKNSTDLINHDYYRWVWFILLLQAICFYLPRWLWKMWESDKMCSLVSDLNFFTKDEVKAKKKDLIVEYLFSTRGSNDWYAIKYFICEFLALLNVFAQMYFIDSCLGGQFLTYGSDFMRFTYFDPQIRVNPMIKIFPRMSKCHFSRFGPSGHVEHIDTLCILTLNVYNEKIFIFLWFWYYFLAIITAIVILFRFVLICCPAVRYYVCRWRFELSIRYGSRKGIDLTRLIVHKLKIGDWFILHMLGQNIEPIIFGEILEELVEKYKKIKSLAENKYSVENNENTNSKDQISYL